MTMQRQGVTPATASRRRRQSRRGQNAILDLAQPTNEIFFMLNPRLARNQGAFAGAT
jgi:hypothetical protein